MEHIKKFLCTSLITLASSNVSAIPETVSWTELTNNIVFSSMFGVWDLNNRTTDPLYVSEPTGTATWYSDSTMTVDSGSFAAAGIISKFAATQNPCTYHEHYFNWETLGNVSVIYLNWYGDQHSTLQPTHLDAAMQVTNIQLDKTTGLTTFTLVGDGGCALNPGVSRVTIMSRTLDLLTPPPAQ